MKCPCTWMPARSRSWRRRSTSTPSVRASPGEKASRWAWPCSACAAGRRAGEPWQRADATLDRLDVSTPALRAVTAPGGDAVYRVTEGRANVLQMLATSETSAGMLLDTIRSRDGVRTLRYLNVPDDDLAAAAL